MKLVDVFLKMKIIKLKFWDKNIGIISILLIPITIFFIFLTKKKKNSRKHV